MEKIDHQFEIKLANTDIESGWIKITILQLKYYKEKGFSIMCRLLGHDQA